MYNDTNYPKNIYQMYNNLQKLPKTIIDSNDNSSGWDDATRGNTLTSVVDLFN